MNSNDNNPSICNRCYCKLNPKAWNQRVVQVHHVQHLEHPGNRVLHLGEHPVEHLEHQPRHGDLHLHGLQHPLGLHWRRQGRIDAIETKVCEAK